MNTFREIRQAIRSLKPFQYWGIQKGYNTETDGTCKRRFFIMAKPYGIGGGVTVFEKWYTI